MKSSYILNEMLDKQLKAIPANKKMAFSDMKRMVKYIDKSIFSRKDCCLWNGYVTNSNVSGKVQYVNFYFKKRKTALHRILYSNFVDSLSDDEYLKFTCENRGKCCNVNHMKKFAYSTRTQDKKKDIEEESESDSESASRVGEDYYTLTFD